MCALCVPINGVITLQPSSCFLSFVFVDHLVTTVGCHPTRCSEFETTKNTTPDEYLHNLSQLIISNPGKVAAIGEFGLGKFFGMLCSFV